MSANTSLQVAQNQKEMNRENSSFYDCCSYLEWSGVSEPASVFGFGGQDCHLPRATVFGFGGQDCHLPRATVFGFGGHCHLPRATSQKWRQQRDVCALAYLSQGWHLNQNLQ